MIELMFPRNVNEAVGIEIAGVIVGAAGVVWGVVAGAVGVVAGVVGMVVVIIGILVVIVGIEVMAGGEFIGADIMPIDRRARPSSGSTEIDAFLLDRRPVARR